MQLVPHYVFQKIKATVSIFLNVSLKMEYLVFNFLQSIILFKKGCEILGY